MKIFFNLKIKKISNKMNHLRALSTNIYRNVHKTTRYFSRNSLFEPDYLDSLKSDIPIYDTLNIQLHGYDYPILENYQKFVHNMLKNMDIEVEETWATPAQELQVTTLKPKSEIVNAQYNLKIYERTIQITDVASSQLPVILRTLEASTPAGVNFTVLPHQEWHEEVRYVPDSELKALKQQLDDLGGPSKKKS